MMVVVESWVENEGCLSVTGVWVSKGGNGLNMYDFSLRPRSCFQVLKGLHLTIITVLLLSFYCCKINTTKVVPRKVVEAIKGPTRFPMMADTAGKL